MARYYARRRRSRRPLARFTQNAEPGPSTRPPEPRPQKPLGPGEVRVNIDQQVGPARPEPDQQGVAQEENQPTEAITMPEAPAGEPEKDAEQVENLKEMSDVDLIAHYQSKITQLREGRKLLAKNPDSKALNAALMQLAGEVMDNEQEQERRIKEREATYQKKALEGIFNETPKLPRERLDRLISLARNEEERREFKQLAERYKFAVRDRVDREYEYRMADATKFSESELGIKEMNASLAYSELTDLANEINRHITEIERQQARAQR